MELARSSTPSASGVVAWGGKLPSMGDFVWSDDRNELTSRLDAWLLLGMHQFRLTQGDHWQTAFDHAPMWNFIVPAGGLSSWCVTGCISPSCDRVGRRFPFVVAFGVPSWHLSKTVDFVPSLLSQTGALLFNGIRRRWPRETLASLIQQAFSGWSTSLRPAEPDTQSQTDASDILTVLMADKIDQNQLTTVPNDRFNTLPWNDVANHLGSHSSTSFWWTNGAGSASLKAFIYGAQPDGALMTWLFGRPST